MSSNNGESVAGPESRCVSSVQVGISSKWCDTCVWQGPCVVQSTHAAREDVVCDAVT